MGCGSKHSVGVESAQCDPQQLSNGLKMYGARWFVHWFWFNLARSYGCIVDCIRIYEHFVFASGRGLLESIDLPCLLSRYK